jgi:hypothetical protein
MPDIEEFACTSDAVIAAASWYLRHCYLGRGGTVGDEEVALEKSSLRLNPLEDF